MNNNPLEIAQLARARAEQFKIAEAEETRKAEEARRATLAKAAETDKTKTEKAVAIRPSDRAIGCMTLMVGAASIGSRAFSQWAERRVTERALAKEEKMAAIVNLAHPVLAGTKAELAISSKLRKTKLTQLWELKMKEKKIREYLGRLDAQLFKKSTLMGARAGAKKRAAKRRAVSERLKTKVNQANPGPTRTNQAGEDLAGIMAKPAPLGAEGAVGGQD